MFTKLGLVTVSCKSSLARGETFLWQILLCGEQLQIQCVDSCSGGDFCDDVVKYTSWHAQIELVS